MCVVAACTFDEKTVAVQPPQVVVHAVLDPGTQEQQVLVERTLSGTVNIRENQRFDAEDPLNTGDGIPVTGAEVTISGPDGTITAIEAPVPGRPSSYSSGRYVAVCGTTKVYFTPCAVAVCVSTTSTARPSFMSWVMRRLSWPLKVSASTVCAQGFVPTFSAAAR